MQNTISILDKIANYYTNTIYSELSAPKDKIESSLLQLIKANASKYDLISSNSISPSFYFSIKSRIKTEDSFREKLIRKNLGLKLIESNSITFENFDDKTILIKRDIELFDDIIGLRIVCDLAKDCKQVLNLITDYISVLNENSIVIIPEELLNQPQKMKNGLFIYRIKGIYDKRIGFELQIKSKIDEAWGDLDHFMFYKDYGFYPAKTDIQNTMNNVGHLLENIEQLLFDLRNSKKNYQVNFKKLDTDNKLTKLFSLSIQKHLKYDYQIDKLTPIIAKLIIEHNSKILEITDPIDLNFNFLEYKVESDYDSYFQSRSSNFELQLIEAIFSIIWEEAYSKSLSLETYEVFISELFNFYVKSIKESLKNDDYDINEVRNIIQLLSISKSEKCFFISFDEYYSFDQLFNLIRDRTYEISQELEYGDEKYDNLIILLRQLLIIEYFEGDCGLVLDYLDISDLDELLYKLKQSYDYKKLESKQDKMKLNIINPVIDKIKKYRNGGN